MNQLQSKHPPNDFDLIFSETDDDVDNEQQQQQTQQDDDDDDDSSFEDFTNEDIQQISSHSFDLQALRYYTATHSTTTTTTSSQIPLFYPSTLVTHLDAHFIFPINDFIDVQNETFASHLHTQRQNEEYLRQQQLRQIKQSARLIRERQLAAAAAAAAAASTSPTPSVTTPTNLAGDGFAVIEELYNYAPFEPFNFGSINTDGPIILNQQSQQLEYLDTVFVSHAIPKLLGLEMPKSLRQQQQHAKQKSSQAKTGAISSLPGNKAAASDGGYISAKSTTTSTKSKQSHKSHDQSNTNNTNDDAWSSDPTTSKSEHQPPRSRGKQSTGTATTTTDHADTAEDGAHTTTTAPKTFPAPADGIWRDPIDHKVYDEDLIKTCLQEVETMLETHKPELYKELLQLHRQNTQQPDLTILPKVTSSACRALLPHNVSSISSQHVSSIFSSRPMQYLSFYCAHETKHATSPLLKQLNEILWFLGYQSIRRRLTTTFNHHYGSHLARLQQQQSQQTASHGTKMSDDVSTTTTSTSLPTAAPTTTILQSNGPTEQDKLGQLADSEVDVIVPQRGGKKRKQPPTVAPTTTTTTTKTSDKTADNVKPVESTTTFTTTTTKATTTTTKRGKTTRTLKAASEPTAATTTTTTTTPAIDKTTLPLHQDHDPDRDSNFFDPPDPHAPVSLRKSQNSQNSQLTTTTTTSTTKTAKKQKSIDTNQNEDGNNNEDGPNNDGDDSAKHTNKRTKRTSTKKPTRRGGSTATDMDDTSNNNNNNHNDDDSQLVSLAGNVDTDKNTTTTTTIDDAPVSQLAPRRKSRPRSNILTPTTISLISPSSDTFEFSPPQQHQQQPNYPYFENQQEQMILSQTSEGLSLAPSISGKLKATAKSKSQLSHLSQFNGLDDDDDGDEEGSNIPITLPSSTQPTIVEPSMTSNKRQSPRTTATTTTTAKPTRSGRNSTKKTGSDAIEENQQQTPSQFEQLQPTMNIVSAPRRSSRFRE